MPRNSLSHSTLLLIFCPFSLLFDPASDVSRDNYVALDETEDKSDCKVRPLPLARGISTSYFLPLMLTPSRSGSDSNLVLRSYRATTLILTSRLRSILATFLGGGMRRQLFPYESRRISTKGGACGGDGDSFSVDIWLDTCACEGEATYQDMTVYASKCVVYARNDIIYYCAKIIEYSSCEVTTTTTTSTTSTSTTTTTPEPKFWPDWLGADTCVFSEKYPQYMQLNPSWTGSTLEDCCE